ncbi:PDZ domain-containing protein [Caloramator sp. mosi_1]|uniref:PDZ domain-containing protein n=1 Tax=Caloramator sp. mosi_1 TaxID=3023090 RepID=UPI00235F7788|nr:PDZ domain-containing protein [Caloramator sp. mosi_1]WDC83721.1 PDZ domain-containing protein [Caloramator sp. mosi_1]
MISKLIWESIRNYAQVVLSFLFEPIFWIMFFILFFQYKRLETIQKDVYGVVKYKKMEMMASSILAGILSGMLISIFITVFGITFGKLEGAIFIIILSLLLVMLFDSHFICLSYSGGIVSLLSLILSLLNSKGIVNISEVPILRNLLNIDITAILILVSLLHLVESILMYFDGARYPVPMFFKKDDKIVGGFILTRFWIIPLMILILLSLTPMSGDTIPTPDWWPLIRPEGLPKDLSDAVFTLTPLFAILGYGDFTISRMPKQKAKESSIHLFLFSITLFILVIISMKIYVFKFIAAIFSPVFHELIIILNRKKEKTLDALWENTYDGIKILDVVPNSPAEKMGIETGDKIISINNIRVNTLYDAKVVLDEADRYLWIDVVKLDGRVKSLEYYNYRTEIGSLGIITIPEDEGYIPVMDLENK